MIKQCSNCFHWLKLKGKSWGGCSNQMVSGNVGKLQADDEEEILTNTEYFVFEETFLCRGYEFIPKQHLEEREAEYGDNAERRKRI